MIYQNDDTAISVMGSLRLMAKNDSAHSVEHNIQNNDSRLGVALRHNINDKGYYAAGYYETGIHGLDSATDNQGNDVYTRQAYAGIGNDEYGVVTFGKQYSPTDWGWELIPPMHTVAKPNMIPLVCRPILLTRLLFIITTPRPSRWV